MTIESLWSPPPPPPVWPCCTERPLRPVGACPFNDFLTGRLGWGAATRGRPWLFSRSGAEAYNYERGQTAAGGGHICGAALTGPSARQRWPRRADSRAPGKTMTGTVAWPCARHLAWFFLTRVRRLPSYLPGKRYCS